MPQGDHSLTIKIEGFEELQKSFENVVRKYPDSAGEVLRQEAYKTRGRVVKLVKNDTEGDGESKRSLKKLTSYAVSPVQGYGAGQYVELSAKSPHFHLVENGHRLTDKSGKSVGKGWVTGYNFMDRAVKKTQGEMKQDMEDMIDKILKKEGLL